MHRGHRPLDGQVSSTLVLVSVVDIEFRYEEFFCTGFGIDYHLNGIWLPITSI
ncbi:MAG: hypothetical protein QXL45_00025 [Candidatus Bathyarchaeia archaeon]